MPWRNLDIMRRLSIIFGLLSAMCHTLHTLIDAVAAPWTTAETHGAGDFLHCGIFSASRPYNFLGMDCDREFSRRKGCHNGIIDRFLFSSSVFGLTTISGERFLVFTIRFRKPLSTEERRFSFLLPFAHRPRNHDHSRVSLRRLVTF
jgi:hypothetical protein